MSVGSVTEMKAALENEGRVPALVALVLMDCAPSPNSSGTTLPQDGRLVTGRRPVLLMQIEVYLFASFMCSF